MADRNLGYDIDVDYDGAQAAQRALDDLQKFERGLDDVERAADTVGETTGGLWDKATSSFTEFKSAMDVVTQGFGYVQQAAQVAWDTINRGADLQRTEQQASALAESIGTNWELLSARMTDATGDMITQSELAASAVDLIGLGLANTADETVRLSTLVGELGWDMQTLTLTLANQSTARLDSLGLSMEDVKKRTEELKEAGYGVEDAFKFAVIEAGEEKLALLGSTADSTKGDLKRLEASWGDLIDTIASRSADASAPLATILVSELKIQEAIKDGIITSRDFSQAKSEAIFTNKTLAETYAELAAEIEEVRDAELNTQVYYELINQQRIEAVQERKRAIEEAAQAEIQATYALQDARDIDPGGGQYAENIKEARQEVYAFKDALYDNAQALIDQANAADEFAAKMEEAATAAADAWSAYVLEVQSASGEAFTGAAFGFDEEELYNQEEAIYKWAQSVGFGAGALSDLAVEYGLVSEEAAAYGVSVAQQEAVNRAISSSFDATRESILQYKVAIESAQNAVNTRATPVDNLDASTYFDQGGDELVNVDASPIVNSIRSAVSEAKGIVEGFTNPDDVYEAIVSLNYDEVEAGASEVTTIIQNIPDKDVLITFTASGLDEILDAINQIKEAA